MRSSILYTVCSCFVQEWRIATGRRREVKRPRHTVEEVAAIFAALPQGDERLRLLVELAAELRAGQAVRARRSDLHLTGGGFGLGRFVVQGGLGFIHADFRRDDTSWLIPLGVGYDYTLPSGTALTATALLNFTNLETGGGSEADVMPGIFFGGRF